MTIKGLCAKRSSQSDKAECLAVAISFYIWLSDAFKRINDMPSNRYVIPAKAGIQNLRLSGLTHPGFPLSRE